MTWKQGIKLPTLDFEGEDEPIFDVKDFEVVKHILEI